MTRALGPQLGTNWNSQKVTATLKTNLQRKGPCCEKKIHLDLGNFLARGNVVICSIMIHMATVFRDFFSPCIHIDHLKDSV